MTLLDAQEYDSQKSRKRNQRIISAIAILLIVAGFVWWNRYWPEEHMVGKFFAALQAQDYKTAYGIWMQDPQWQQHPQNHPKYPFNEFYRDWGPGGEWGLVKTAKVYAASPCPALSTQASPNDMPIKKRRIFPPAVGARLTAPWPHPPTSPAAPCPAAAPRRRSYRRPR